jgi:hypothetical protein
MNEYYVTMMRCKDGTAAHISGMRMPPDDRNIDVLKMQSNDTSGGGQNRMKINHLYLIFK